MPDTRSCEHLVSPDDCHWIHTVAMPGIVSIPHQLALYFPELSHTYFLIDPVFSYIHALWQHPPIAWAWNLDIGTYPY